MAAEKRGSIAFSATYRPPVPLDLFSCPRDPKSEKDEIQMSDGESYNYNGQEICSAALKTILKRPKLASLGYTEADVNSGRLSAMVFVSERGSLETLHIALRFFNNIIGDDDDDDDDDDGDGDDKVIPKVNVFSFADVFGTFDGVRMEDSGCIAGHYFVYVSTKEDPAKRRQPWTAVYKTHLITGKTHRLTPPGHADLSPSVQPSGKKIAVASFQGKGGWEGEIEDLMTDIFVMNVEEPFDRRCVVRNGGWPTWGSDSVIFFHRKVGKFWGVFRADISSTLTSDPPSPTLDTTRVTQEGIDAITPAAINATTVAVATIRQKSGFSDVRVQAQHRHIEIFDSTWRQPPIQITQKTTPKADHFNPFVIDGGKRIGYHRCRTELLKKGDVTLSQCDKLHSPHPDVGLFRVSGIFPTLSKDGSKLAFVDNEFKAVWVADSKGGLRRVFKCPTRSDNNTELPEYNIFSPVWNQDTRKDILYVNIGPSFNAGEVLDIYAIPTVSRGRQHRRRLTFGSNNAFPSTDPKGKRLVFRSTRDGGVNRYKNLYILEDIESGDQNAKITRLTEGEWTDTHCQWSPSGDWIVFSSTRDKPKYAPKTDNGLDPGYFAVFLVNANDPSVVVRVIGSGSDVAGHVNHPFFSPDGMSIVVTSDLAAVSVDPISLPLFVHSVRPYGDIFTVDIDPDDIKKNEDVKKFNRITHSRYENSTATWTKFSTQDSTAAWNQLFNEVFPPLCPLVEDGSGGENWNMTGHLRLGKRCC